MNRKSRAWIAGTGALFCFLLVMFLLGWHIGVESLDGQHLTTGLDGALKAVGISALTVIACAALGTACWFVMDWINKGDQK